MANIIRFSGYLVRNNPIPYGEESFIEQLKWIIESNNKFIIQQLHAEKSEEFDPDGEFEKNCDLALLTRHFKKKSSMEFDRPLPKEGEVYRHFKIGKLVTIIGISRHTETEEVDVVYKCEDTIWSRPLEMFMSEVDHEKYPDSTQKYRFELV